MGDGNYTRRGFMGVCAALATAAAAWARAGTAAPGTLQGFERVLLVDAGDRPLRIADLEPGRDYVFSYPYVCTPCFLLKLDRPTRPAELVTEDGLAYRWPGGVGPDRSLVAYAAICAHRLTHPSPQVSFIGYRPDPVGYRDADNHVARRAGVIQCCSEHSLYDPAEGARVVAGPAPQPLAAIDLREEEGRLYAVGVYGGALYDRFFERFGFRLALDFGQDRYADRVTGSARVLSLEDYSRHRIHC